MSNHLRLLDIQWTSHPASKFAAPDSTVVRVHTGRAYGVIRVVHAVRGVKYQPSPWLGLVSTRRARSCTARSAIPASTASSPAPPLSGRLVQLIVPGEVLLAPQELQAVDLRLLTDR